MTDAPRLTYSQLGEALDGITKQAVSKLAKLGMPTDSVEAARAWRLANLDAGRAKANRLTMQAPASVPAAVPPPAPPQDEPDDTSPDDSSEYRRHRAERERINAERAQIELDQMRGKLISLDEASRLAFTAARSVRDAVLNVPARVKDQLAAETDAFRVEQLLNAELVSALQNFSAERLLQDADDDDTDAHETG